MKEAEVRGESQSVKVLEHVTQLIPQMTRAIRKQKRPLWLLFCNEVQIMELHKVKVTWKRKVMRTGTTRMGLETMHPTRDGSIHEGNKSP